MDNGFDPCECVYSTQWAMRRLLQILRQTQQQCNENECFPTGVDGENDIGGGGNDSTMFYMMIMWVVFAVLLFFTRPASLRGSPQAEKSNGSNSDRNGGNPPPDVPPVQ